MKKKFDNTSSFFSVWPFWLSPTFIVAVLICLLHLLDRQVELTSRYFDFDVDVAGGEIRKTSLVIFFVNVGFKNINFVMNLIHF
jgi:hypothetical protein